MAPRRTRKVGLRRIDAALDALRPMGFGDNVIRKTIRDLLKVYGGDDGWIFIEECQYKLVYETILQEQENTEDKKLEENCSEKNDSLKDVSGTQPGPSPVDSPMDDNMEEQPGIQPCSSPVPSPQKDNIDDEPGTQPCCLFLARSLQNHSTPVTCPPPTMDIIPWSSKDETTQDMTGKHFPSPQLSSAGVPLLPQSPSPVNSHQGRVRKPCYGWISSDDDDDEDEEDLVQLRPAIDCS